MARSRWTDVLQAFPFWLMDVSFVGPGSGTMLTPLFGFSSISAPEMTIETEDIKEANWYFKRKIIRQATVATMTLTRGATFYDSDFWSWAMFALMGTTYKTRGLPIPTLFTASSPRRTLVLIHYFSHVAIPGVRAAEKFVNDNVSSVLASPFGVVARVPARAWILQNCIPSRYKSGTDFDASTGEVSVMELDLEVEYFEEVSLALANVVLATADRFIPGSPGNG